MRGDRGFVLGVLVVMAVAGSVLGFAQDGRAQTTVDIIVRATDALVIGAGGDIVIFTGRATSTDQVGTCVALGATRCRTAW